MSFRLPSGVGGNVAGKMKVLVLIPRLCLYLFESYFPYQNIGNYSWLIRFLWELNVKYGNFSSEPGRWTQKCYLVYTQCPCKEAIFVFMLQSRKQDIEMKELAQGHRGHTAHRCCAGTSQEGSVLYAWLTQSALPSWIKQSGSSPTAVGNQLKQ